MAKNTIYTDPDVVEMTAPRTLVSGDGCLVGALFGVAQTDAASGSTVPIMVKGAHRLPKAAGEITAGARVWWNNTNFNITTTAGSNFMVGFALATAADAATTVDVLLMRGPASGA